MLCLNPCLHSWWAKPHWGIECTGIEPRAKEGGGHKYAVVLLFHWMPNNKGTINPGQAVDLQPGANDCRKMVDALMADASDGQGRGEATSAGYMTAIQHDSFRPIVSGQEFEVVVDTADDAENMREMVNDQWACVRIAAMSGAAGPDDLSDTFSEFDFERNLFEFHNELGYFDDHSDS